ncbi:hypothetical protein IL306_000152 [Fusarium sp. DS 682]|nr:hypothetical protein IL306_000152 [Fusarium sp. DS 682]
MAGSSPNTPNTPTSDQQGLRRSSRSTRGQLKQDHFLLQNYVVGEEATRPTPGPRRRRTLQKPAADDEDELDSPTASNEVRRPKKQSHNDSPAELGSHEDTPATSAATVASGSHRRNSAPASHLSPSSRRTASSRQMAPLHQGTSLSMNVHQGQQTMSAFPQQQAFQAEPQQMAPQLAQHAPQFQAMPQGQNLPLPEPVQSGQVVSRQQLQQQPPASASNAPGAHIHPADVMLDPEDLFDPQISSILSSGIPHQPQFNALYNAIHEDRRAQEERSRLAAQEEQAKAADAEVVDQEMIDALWDQFINPDAFE